MNEIQTSVSVAQNPNAFLGDFNFTGGGTKQAQTLYLVIAGIALVAAVVLVFVFGGKRR